MPIRVVKAMWNALPLAITVVALWVPMSWIVDRTIPQEYLSGVIENETAPRSNWRDTNAVTARAGDTLAIHWRIIASRTCTIEVVRHIVDAHNVQWDFAPTPSASVDQKNPVPLAREVKLPLAISPGPAYYFATVTYRCNPSQHFWPIRSETPRIHFEVIE